MKKLRCANCGVWFLPFGRSAEQMVYEWSWHPCVVEKERDNIAAALGRRMHPAGRNRK